MFEAIEPTDIASAGQTSNDLLSRFHSSIPRALTERRGVIDSVITR